MVLAQQMHLHAATRRDFVVGRNCRFMQGPGTDAQEVRMVRQALDDPQPRPFTVRPSMLPASPGHWLSSTNAQQLAHSTACK